MEFTTNQFEMLCKCSGPNTFFNAYALNKGITLTCKDFSLYMYLPHMSREMPNFFDLPYLDVKFKSLLDMNKLRPHLLKTKCAAFLLYVSALPDLILDQLTQEMTPINVRVEISINKFLLRIGNSIVAQSDHTTIHAGIHTEMIHVEDILTRYRYCKVWNDQKNNIIYCNTNKNK